MFSPIVLNFLCIHTVSVRVNLKLNEPNWFTNSPATYCI